MERVKAGGGRSLEGPLELPGGSWIARCADPQGAMFALQGKRSQVSQIGWSTEWSGFSSRGRLVAPKPRGRAARPGFGELADEARCQAALAAGAFGSGLSCLFDQEM